MQGQAIRTTYVKSDGEHKSEEVKKVSANENLDNCVDKSEFSESSFFETILAKEK